MECLGSDYESQVSTAALSVPGPAASFNHSTNVQRVPTMCQKLYSESLELVLREHTVKAGVGHRHGDHLYTLRVAQKKWQ